MDRQELDGAGPELVNFSDYGSTEALDDAFDDRWIYVGREMVSLGLPASPLGNPFTVEDHGRQSAIDQYRQWLDTEQKSADPASNSVVRALHQIEHDSVLVCWCVPEPCHGEVVLDAWRDLV